jgi:Lon protease-like protein
MWANLLFLPTLAHFSLAFSPTPVQCSVKSSPFSLIKLCSAQDDEMERKMAIVRSLQSAYYQSNSAEPTVLEKKTGIMRNLPLWRVQWTELPGRSNVLNVHEGIYTNLFETLLRGPKPWYVGHLYLPGGSKNIRSEEEAFQLKTWEKEAEKPIHSGDKDRSAVVGTLLKVSDFRRLADGRLTLLVQALERFVVVNCVQTLPYSIADVQILPDFDEAPEDETEDKARTRRASQVMESFQWHNYEYDEDFKLPLADSKYLDATDIWGPDIAKVLPFVPYAKLDPPQLKAVECGESKETGDFASSLNDVPSVESRLLERRILSEQAPLMAADLSNLSADELEERLWVALEDFCKATKLVIPDEVLCLLPPERSWSTPVDRVSSEYPSQRRQRRLSFAASAFLEQTRVGGGLRQAWLETPGTLVRLRGVLERYEIVNNLLMGKYQ